MLASGSAEAAGPSQSSSFPVLRCTLAVTPEMHPTASDPQPPHNASSEPTHPARHPKTSRRQPSMPFRYLAYQLRLLDRLLVRLSAVFSSPASTDALLGTLSYTLDLLAALLSRFLAHRFVSVASNVAEKADQVLLPGETFITTLPTTPADQLVAKIAASSKALAQVVADYRIFARLWGLAGLYMWARASWNTPIPKEEGTKAKLVRQITWAQIATLFGFQVLENGAYLASKGVLASSAWAGEAGKSREIRWWVWSSRFWAAYVALELSRVAMLRYYAGRDLSSSGETETLVDGEKEGKLLIEHRREEQRLWWRDLVSNIAYMPMTLHWSVDGGDGFLTDWGVGLLGAVASGSLFMHAWKQTV